MFASLLAEARLLMYGNGWFWPSDDNKRVRGDFQAKIGHKAEVTLAGSVVNDPSVTTTIASDTGGEIIVTELGDPKAVVAAFSPINLHGRLDAGTPVTLLGAQNHAAGLGPLGEPNYAAMTAVVGAHVSDKQLYGAIRFQLDAPAWTSRLSDGQASVVPDDGSLLRVETTARGKWLVYESSTPASQRALASRVVLGCQTLARLALERPVTIRETQVRIGESGGWLGLHSRSYRAPTVGFGPSLLPREELTLPRFANWIALNDKLDGLARAASEPVEAAVQAQVLVYASLVEGIHRRLDERYQQSRFPEASKGSVDRVRRAAKQGAKEQAEREEKVDPGDASKAVMDAVVPIGDVGYRARAHDIVRDVTSAVPELAESIPDLAGELLHARNNLAHHLLAGKTQSLADRIDRMIVLSYATPWLLRLLLLLQIGVDPHVLRQACLGSESFGFYRENIFVLARGLGWIPITHQD